MGGWIMDGWMDGWMDGRYTRGAVVGMAERLAVLGLARLGACVCVCSSYRFGLKVGLTFIHSSVCPITQSPIMPLCSSAQTHLSTVMRHLKMQSPSS
jgi:hypothetical protein